MKLKDLKQRQLVRHTKTGKTYKVSKCWHGIYLVNPETKKREIALGRFDEEREITHLETIK